MPVSEKCAYDAWIKIIKLMAKKEFLEEGKVPNLPECMSVIIEELQTSGKYSAVHTYRCTLRSFMMFSGKTEEEMPVNAVFAPGVLKAYQEWLLGKELSWNTISTYMRTLRAVANRIFPPGSEGYNPKLFDDVYTKVESQTKRALTERQIHSLLTVDLEKLPNDLRSTLAYFRLMFLFRGMPFIDLVHLRKRDVCGKVLIYCRHKTGRRMTVSIPKEAVPLLKVFANRNPSSIYLFPVLDGSLTTGAELYTCYLCALRNFNKRLAKLASRILPGVKVSSYTARHTWATLSFHLGIPVGIISEALGHSSVRVTETYLKPFENERIDRANSKLITAVIKCKLKTKSLFNVL